MTKNENRQSPTVAIVGFTYTDFVSGVGQVAVDLPSGAIVTGGFLVIDTAFNSATSDTLEVGDAGSAARYKGSIDGQAAALTALVPTGDALVSTTGSIKVEVTSVGAAATAGSGRLVVEYIYAERGDFIQR